MRYSIAALSLCMVVCAAMAQDEFLFPYESPDDITVRTGWEDVALGAFVKVSPEGSQPAEILTDGLNRENEGERFIAWQGLGEPLEIVVDLGQIRDDLLSFRVFWAVDYTGLGGPVADWVAETQVSVSTNGTNYTVLGNASSEDMSKPNANDYTIRHCVNDLTLTQPVSGRYVRFYVENPPANVMCSEVTVLREIAVPADATNIAVGKPYVTDPPGNDGSRPDDGIRLTDGQLAADASTDVTGWVSFPSTEVINITIDLGALEHNLVAFRAWYAAWESAFVFVVGTMYVEVSDNGTDFTRLGMVPKLYDQDEDPSFVNVPYLLIPQQPVSARYVRFITMGSDSNTFTTFACELEVYQGVPTGVSSWELF